MFSCWQIARKAFLLDRILIVLFPARQHPQLDGSFSQHQRCLGGNIFPIWLFSTSLDRILLIVEEFSPPMNYLVDLNHNAIKNTWKKRVHRLYKTLPCRHGGIQAMPNGATPLKPTKVTLLTMIFCNSEYSIRGFKANLPSSVLSQQCCEVYFISLTVVNP